MISKTDLIFKPVSGNSMGDITITVDKDDDTISLCTANADGCHGVTWLHKKSMRYFIETLEDKLKELENE